MQLQAQLRGLDPEKAWREAQGAEYDGGGYHTEKQTTLNLKLQLLFLLLLHCTGVPFWRIHSAERGGWKTGSNTV